MEKKNTLFMNKMPKLMIEFCLEIFNTGGKFMSLLTE